MPKLGTRLDVSSALAGGQAADVAGEWRRDEDYGSIDVQVSQSLARRCAQVRRHGDEEWRRVARRSNPRRPGYLHQAAQTRSTRQVDAVGHPTSQLGHLRPETPDNDRWRR